MGQRLNLEIWNDGKVLANAYYHWSGYTSSAADIVNEALNYIKNNSIENDNILLYAIRILEATDAGLTERETNYANTLKCLKGAKFAECKGRNDGLISISKDGINETRFWQEASVYIFIDEKRISFRVFWKQRAWEYEKEQREEYDNIVNTKDLEHAEWNIDEIKFNSWKEFCDFLKTQDYEPWISEINPCEVIVPIEY